MSENGVYLPYHRENDDEPLDLGVTYFQINPQPSTTHISFSGGHQPSHPPQVTAPRHSPSAATASSSVLWDPLRSSGQVDGSGVAGLIVINYSNPPKR